MTDRFNGLTVALDQDIREDDAECIINAIKMLKGVIGVEGCVVSPEDYLARSRVRNELLQKVYDAIND